MRRPLRSTAARGRVATLACAALLAVAGTGCGQGKIDVDKKSEAAATLFNERCSGCHSLDKANSYGSKPPGKANALVRGERTDGPNFNVRKEKREDVLFAIRNGGFSGAIMPANIVVGREAEMLADFLAKYSGSKPSEAQ